MTDKKNDDKNLGLTFGSMNGKDVERFVQGTKNMQPPDTTLEDEVNAVLAESDLNEKNIDKNIFGSGEDETPSDENQPPNWLKDLPDLGV